MSTSNSGPAFGVTAQVVLIEYEPVPDYDLHGPAHRMTAAGRRTLTESRLRRGVTDVSGALSVCVEHLELEPCPHCALRTDEGDT